MSTIGAQAGGPVLALPGDKSLAHRVLLVAARAEGTSVIHNLPRGDDVQRTAGALRALGAVVVQHGDTAHVHAPHGLTAPATPLLCGESGTTARLLMGFLAGQQLTATLHGDAGLNRRPMGRVARPLGLLFDDATAGHALVALNGDGLPATVDAAGRAPRGGAQVDTAAPSAQVKGALLLALLDARGPVTITEQTTTRTATEDLLVERGALLHVEERGGGRAITVRGATPRHALVGTLPADPSSAAQLAVGVAAGARRAVTFAHCMLDPHRLGFFRALAAMGVSVTQVPRAPAFGAPTGDLVVRGAVTRGLALLAHEIPDLIDELPALVAVALAAGVPLRAEGIAELRVKESDRAARLVDLAHAVGAPAARVGDVLEIGARTAPTTGALHARTDGDHRLAMAAHALARVLGREAVLDVPGCERKSFPEFGALLDALWA